MKKLIRGLAITLAVFVLLFTGGILLINAVSARSGAAETELVRSAVQSAVVTCYAVEGSYPTGADYLKEHYGLAYNEDRYTVVYDAFASNIMPVVTVLEKGENE